MAKTHAQDRIRVQLDFLKEAYDELVQLQEDTGAPSKIETVRYALRTLQWINQSIQQGGTILIDKNGIRQEVIFPFLSASTRKRSVVSV